MPKTPPDLADLAEQVAQLRAQVHALSAGAGLRNASMREGTITIADEDGNPKVRVGMQPDGRGATIAILDDTGTERATLGELAGGSYGFQVNDASGRATLKVNDVGLTEPPINLPYRRAQEGMGPYTSSSFQLTWETSLGAITHDSLRWASLITTDFGTTAQAQLRIPSLGLTSATQGIGSDNVAARTRWNWRPPLVPEKRITAFLVQLWVRRETGAGNIYAYPPDVLFMANGADIGATATGV